MAQKLRLILTYKLIFLGYIETPKLDKVRNQKQNNGYYINNN
jgi:hypothetical protein